MKIAINAQLLNTDPTYRSAGVSKYSEHLLRYMDRIETPTLELTAFTNANKFTLQQIKLCRSRLPLENPLARIAWEQSVLPLLLRQQRADLVHGLVNIVPLISQIPSVVTIHDLSFLRMPEVLPRFKAAYLARLCRASVTRASHIIAVSQQTADDVMHFFNVPAAKIDVIFNGVGEQFIPLDCTIIGEATAQKKDAEFKQKRHLPEKFVLYLGTLEPRKNLDVLLDGYARWRARPDADPTVKLVLAGAKGWFYEQIFDRVRLLKLEDSVFFPGYVPDEDLPTWYRAALCFVYPSLFEGFGMPATEAMACGTPVITSKAQSLQEVVGDAGLTFETESADDLADKLGALLADPHLRTHYSERGIVRAARFTWSRAAAETIDVYRHALT